MYAPAMQAVQTREVDPLFRPLYRPAAQAVHALLPISELNVPAVQAVHTREVDPPKRSLYCPAAHDVHTVDVVAETTLPNIPAAQAVHDASPSWSAYCPTAQALHDGAPAVMLENEPAGHAVHADAPVARLL